MQSAQNIKKQGVRDSQPSEVQKSMPLEARDICVGCIVWLPKYIPDGPSLQCIQSNCSDVLGIGGYNHPVVVLSVRQNGTSRTIGDLIITIALVSC
jgi:hypothetical protein